MNGDIFAFVGVTASASSINRVFPRWAKVLELGDVVFEPIDLEPDVDAATYRGVVGRIKSDAAYRGALVTTHKVRLLAASRDLFDMLDPNATLLGEVSCLSKNDGLLIGHAKDPITAGRSLDDFVPEGHFDRTAADVLCLGAGGAGLAIAVRLLGTARWGRPRRVVLLDRDPERLVECERILAAAEAGERAEFVLADGPDVADRLCSGLPAGSMVINATGMGKDRPGSPLTDAAVLPEGGLVWELNYRGELNFLHQAASQADARGLTVVDGWRYFIHGWSEVVAEVFDIALDGPMLERLSEEAAATR